MYSKQIYDLGFRFELIGKYQSSLEFDSLHLLVKSNNKQLS